ncbi:MAG TPA: replicative DNA helicase [Gemmatimonadales bacterium]|nr:replicative DNA helicase [Gemmatimonadales bacterium]
MTDLPLIDLEAEQCVLGALIQEQDPVQVFPVRELLPTPESFGTAPHQEIYRTLLALLDQGTPIDHLTLRNALEAAKSLEAVGGLRYLADLVDAVPTAANLVHHAGIVRAWHQRRQVARQGERLLRLAHDRELRSEDLLAQSMADLTQTAVQAIGLKRRSWSELLFTVGEKIEAQAASGRMLQGVPSGFIDLDRLTLGWRTGDLIVIAARPSVGKSSFALRLARNAAEAFVEAPGSEAPLVALVISLEMGQEDLVERLLSAESGVAIRSCIARGRFTDRDLSEIARAQTRLGALPIRILDQATHRIRTPGQVRIAIQHFEATERQKVGLVIVDYVQYLRHDGQEENRNRELGEITKTLKTMGLQLGFPVVLLGQLNRESVKSNRRPQLSDLRDSGEIEQDADLVLFLHRDEKAENWGPPGKTEVILEKQRNGPTGLVTLELNKYTQQWHSFLNLSETPREGAA